MSTPLLIIFSLLEAVLLVVVLAAALLKVAQRLRTIVTGLEALASGVGDIQGDLRLITPTVPQINAPLKDIVGALPALAEMAETLATRAGK